MKPEPRHARRILSRTAAALLLPAYALIFGLVLWIRRGSPHSVTMADRIEFSWLWAAIVLGLALVYVLIYRHADRFPFWWLISVYLVVSLLLLLMPVLFSSDIHMYAMRGRILSVYHQNPYLVPAAQFPEDPFLGLTHTAWRVLPQNYGPLWTLFSALLTWIGGARLFGTILLFKLSGFVGNTLGLWLVSRLAGDVAPKTRREIVVLYALNPLILMEFVNNGHNDVWMVVFGLLALHFYRTKKDLWIVPSLILAGLIKYVFWLLIPVFLVFLWREKRLHLKVMLGSGSLSLACLAAGYAPFWHGAATFSGVLGQLGIERSFNHYSPLPLMLFIVMIAHRRPLESLKSGLVVGRVLFLAAYAKVLASARVLDPAIVSVLTAFAFLGTATVLPWYVLWWLPFLILGNRLRPVVIWSLVGLGGYFFLYSTTLSLAMVGGAYLVFQMTKEPGSKGEASPSPRQGR
jgi:hypothetical protein